MVYVHAYCTGYSVLYDGYIVYPTRRLYWNALSTAIIDLETQYIVCRIIEYYRLFFTNNRVEKRRFFVLSKFQNGVLYMKCTRRFRTREK